MKSWSTLNIKNCAPLKTFQNGKIDLRIFFFIKQKVEHAFNPYMLHASLASFFNNVAEKFVQGRIGSEILEK
jgi:hypothetical protein